MADMNIPNSKSQKIEPGKIQGQQNLCPICMDDTKYEVETNCGHKFCCQCWITYVANFSFLIATLCPYCTQRVKILKQCFSERELNPPSNFEKFLQEIKTYNRRFSDEPRTFFEKLREISILLSKDFREFFVVNAFFVWFIVIKLFGIILTILTGLIRLFSNINITQRSVFEYLGIRIYTNLL